MTGQEKLSKAQKMYAKEISILNYLLRIYPDLEIVKDRWNKEYYCSEEVNKKATDYHSWHSCGCCADSPLYVNPYIKEGDTYVYAKPLNICVGEKETYISGDILYPDWKETLLKYKINETIIEKVEKDYGQND